MKIKRGYALKKLKTKTVKMQLLGGEKDYTAYCTGYYVGGYTAPSRKFLEYNTDAVLKNAETIKFFNAIGTALAITTTGQIYKWINTTASKPFTYSGLVGTYLHSAFECFRENEPVVAVVSGPRITFVGKEKYLNRQIPFQLKGACCHAGRIFGVDTQDNCVIRWSGTDYLDWTQSLNGSGYIRLGPERGALFRTIPFGDSLVVYREFGFDVVKAFGDPRHFTVVRQGVKNVTERLNEDACAVCGGKIYCCSYGNIYCFDGENIQTVKLPEYMKAVNFRAGRAYSNRYVHFYCKPELYGEECQLEIDTVGGTYSFFAPGKEIVWEQDTGFFAWKDNVVYKETPNGYDMPCVWRTPSIDFGNTRLKMLKKLYVKNKPDAQVTVIADGVSRTFKESGELYVGMSGRSFVVEVSGKGKTQLLEAEWEVRE